MVGDAHKNDRETKQREHQMKRLKRAGVRSESLVFSDEFPLLGNPECRDVEPEQTAVFLRTGAPGKITEAYIRERMAKRRQFPIQDRDDPGFAWVEHHVADAKIAVRDGDSPVVRGQVLREPFRHGVERRIGSRWRLRPLT